MSRNRNRKRPQKTCHCAAYAFPHRHDVRRCMIEDGDMDLSADYRADDPRRGQAREINAMKRRVF